MDNLDDTTNGSATPLEASLPPNGYLRLNYKWPKLQMARHVFCYHRAFDREVACVFLKSKINCMELVELSGNRIVCMPGVLNGKPAVRGTRIGVDIVVSCLAGGMSITDVLADYPTLSADDVQACQTYAKTALGV